MRTILLIMIGLSAFLSADFTKNENVVTDSATGLMWQDTSENNSATYNWQEAIASCEALTLDTYDDWRLPNINELKTLIDRSKRTPALVDGFEYVQASSYYWSSTSVEGGFEYGAWIVLFNDGNVRGNAKGNNNYVRCVRDGQ